MEQELKTFWQGKNQKQTDKICNAIATYDKIKGPLEDWSKLSHYYHRFYNDGDSYHHLRHMFLRYNVHQPCVYNDSEALERLADAVFVKALKEIT